MLTGRHGWSRQQQGIALVLVLWVVVLLSVIAGAMAMAQRTGVIMTGNIRQDREARALVDAGLNFMVLMLERRNQLGQDNRWPVDGRLHPWVFGKKNIWVAAMPENARIDLNLVDQSVLQSLLHSVGLEEEQAMAVRDAILDWRDTDDVVHEWGAEDPEYYADGRPIGARDTPFLSVEELQQVMGVSPDLYRKLALTLTVDARQSMVNPAFASREVLLAMPDATAEEVDAYLLERQQMLDQGLPVTAPTFGGGSLRVRAGSRFRLFAEVDLLDGRKAQGMMVVGIESRTSKGYRVLQKHYGKFQSLGRIVPAQEGN
ncbi:MAG TPA: hypothetical protein ENG92_03720 [Thiolapillus brandeum]|uniref:T2SS protein K first SAM-like domain-containing protein n=1 Tax=Thiolapillus brandeum TaxID=1076588 RepID=A0A831K923_9GAMM|nr:hypothetical protein [Thiolapillus brandeum]